MIDDVLMIKMLRYIDINNTLLFSQLNWVAGIDYNNLENSSQKLL